MSDERLNILFIHGAFPSQFSLLHKHFQETGLANSFFLTSEGSRAAQQYGLEFPNRVLSYTPDGDNNSNSYYYSGSAEKNARSALNILHACKRIVENHPLDLIVAHSLIGPPQMLFDEVSAAIISYVEFPSFRHHLWDLQYPPQDAQRYCDKYDEALNYYAALKSDLVITPSLYAKHMFPEKLQYNIVAQMEGFDPQDLKINQTDKAPFTKEAGYVYMGYSANSLSSEKGFEQFIQVSKKLSQLNPNIRYVVMGDPNGTSYGYESNLMDSHFGQPRTATFKDYLFTKYAVDEQFYIFTGRLDKAALSTAIHHVDFFVYPLQFGSANWGIYEILLRGKIVIASNRCFLPELITDSQNGFLVDYDNIDGWADICNQIATNLEGFQYIARNAEESGKKYHIENVAKEYLDIFSQVVEKKKRASH